MLYGFCCAVGQRPLVSLVCADKELTKLSRKHGLKISAGVPCSVEDCSLTVGDVVGHSSIKSAARMNGTVVIFVDSVEKVN